jgi:hypothetical protein
MQEGPRDNDIETTSRTGTCSQLFILCGAIDKMLRCFERERRLKGADQEAGLWLARQRETKRQKSSLRAKTRLPKFNDLE